MLHGDEVTVFDGRWLVRDVLIVIAAIPGTGGGGPGLGSLLMNVLEAAKGEYAGDTPRRERR